MTASARQAAVAMTTTVTPVNAASRTLLQPLLSDGSRRRPTVRSQGSLVTKRQVTHAASAGENMRTVMMAVARGVPRPPAAAQTASSTKAVPIATAMNRPAARQRTVSEVLGAVVSISSCTSSGLRQARPSTIVSRARRVPPVSGSVLRVPGREPPDDVPDPTVVGVGAGSGRETMQACRVLLRFVFLVGRGVRSSRSSGPSAS